MDFDLIRNLDWPAVFNRALSRGGWLAEAFVEDASTISLQMEEHRLEKSTAGRDTGLGLRILFGRRTVYGYTTDLSPANIMNLAGELAKAVTRDEPGRAKDLAFEALAPAYTILKPYHSADLAAKADLVRRANRAAWQVDERIRQVKVIYLERSQRVFIANSSGLAKEDTRHNLAFLCQVVSSENGVIQTGYQPYGGTLGLELFEQHRPEAVGAEAARRSILMLEAKPAPGGRMPVVIGGTAGGTMVHEAVGHGLEADLALEGLSVYSGKMGQSVASALVNVIDDATIPAIRGSFGCDDEGTSAQKTELIKSGVLAGYMTDLTYARQGDLVATGNGRRENFRHRPVVRMTNTIIAPGQSNPESIVADTPEGLYVARMGGGQVNTATGEFVFEVSEGYLINKGQIGQPVRGATLVGNGPEVLQAIDAVGTDLGYAIGTCGKDGQGVPVGDAQPTLRIAELLVGGAV